MGLSRRGKAGAVALLAGLIGGCHDVDAPVRKSGAVQLLLHLESALAGETLDVLPSYRRANATDVALEPQNLVLDATPSQSLSITVDITSCLLDPAREGTGNGCPLPLALVLRNAQREVLDSQQVGPLNAVPGSPLAAPPVTLRQIQIIAL